MANATMLNMTKSLTAQERETTITWSADSDVAYISTQQRPMITKLRKNAAATETYSYYFGTTECAEFEVPASLVSIRSKSKAGKKLSDEQAKAVTERLAKGRRAAKAAT